jgi:hypothetical protein
MDPKDYIVFIFDFPFRLIHLSQTSVATFNTYLVGRLKSRRSQLRTKKRRLFSISFQNPCLTESAFTISEPTGDPLDLQNSAFGDGWAD